MEQSDETFTLHDNSIIFAIDTSSTNTLTIPSSDNTSKSIYLSIEYPDLTMDSDGSIAAPKIDFLIKIGSPIIATASTVA